MPSRPRTIKGRSPSLSISPSPPPLPLPFSMYIPPFALSLPYLSLLPLSLGLCLLYAPLPLCIPQTSRRLCCMNATTPLTYNGCKFFHSYLTVHLNIGPRAASKPLFRSTKTWARLFPLVGNSFFLDIISFEPVCGPLRLHHVAPPPQFRG